MQYNTGAPSVVNQYLKSGRVQFGESEDCLTLNIWVPRKDRIVESLPVMIWIPGGALLSGDASTPNYDDTSFVENQNVIAVTMNYRVNIFGFPAAAALDGRHRNVGSLDKRMAIESVYNYIYTFGGGPSRVILLGGRLESPRTDFYAQPWYDDPLGLLFNRGQWEIPRLPTAKEFPTPPRGNR
ncbi:alpha/beta-hydrolase [Zopfia rhizophila CBS 207.26]|uniref:Alpha/beta-hydrolase n=1 Tax=Zopfia rhizophila CBS 207.26 TaxID=1314779 RepID=A0A6A6ENN7_9PEZI|nr:alpha/beta-hydrolase [Zopfia rhizophila CBS 207.26]